MMEWVIDFLAPIPDIDRVFVVTNNKFAADFEKWAQGYMIQQPKLRFTIVNDGSTSDADKLGAIGDIQHVIQSQGIAGQDLIVVAGDNLFSESLEGFAAFGKQHPATVALYDVGDLEQVKKFNLVETDEAGVITRFEEKPANPINTQSAIALYYYRADVVPLFGTYIAEGNNPDQPGRFIEWLHKRVAVHTWPVPGKWFDIGSKETLEEAGNLWQAFS